MPGAKSLILRHAAWELPMTQGPKTDTTSSRDLKLSFCSQFAVALHEAGKRGEFMFVDPSLDAHRPTLAKYL